MYSKSLPTRPLSYGKSLSAGPFEVSSTDLTTKNLEATLLAILSVTFFTCHCWSMTTKKGRVYKNITRCTRMLRGVQEHYYTQEWYESSTSNITTPDSLTQPSLTFLSFTMRALPPSTAYDSSIYPSYNSANSSAPQATTSHGVHRRGLFISV